MNTFTLFDKDYALITFNYYHDEVLTAVVNRNTVNKLPLPLKRILFDKGHIDMEESTNEFYALNEEGCGLLYTWLNDRQIPLNRENLHKYVEHKHDTMEFMLENHAFSFVDNYWVKDRDSELTWDNILEKREQIDEIYSYQKDGKEYYKGYNATLGGQLEKYWYKENGILMLCKKTAKGNDILNAREVFASLIYQKQNQFLGCKYQFVYDTKNEIVGCKCPSFIADDSTELITAYDLLEEFNRTQDDNCYELIIDYASKYGIKKDVVRDY